VLEHVRQQCAHFVSTARVRARTVPAGDIATEQLQADVIYITGTDAGDERHPDGHLPPVASNPRASTLFSTATTPTVPLCASRVSLPDSLRAVPLTSVLPPSVADAYSAPQSAALLRDPLEVQLLNLTRPLKPPRVAGSRAEYVRLIARLHRLGMVAFTRRPRAVNGVFAVAKDADSDRLIIDAQPANRLFVDSPSVALPNASHLVQLRVPRGARLYVGKSDLSNFYHHFLLPAWLQPFFCLPPLTPAEQCQLGLPEASEQPLWPMCTTLPMGFSHAVYLAQTAHEHIVYSAGAVRATDSVLCLDDPELAGARCLHGIYIDDFFLFSLCQRAADAALERVLAAYRRAGFVVKPSKLVRPLCGVVTVLGFDIDGVTASICVSGAAARRLIHDTQRAMLADTVSGRQMERLLGHWLWLLLLRRPSLAVLQHCYRYAELAGTRPFTLWLSVRRELRTLLDLLPLLRARLNAPLFERVLASDASEYAAGVVAAPRSAELTAAVWPLCCSRLHGPWQAELLAEATRGSQRSPDRPPIALRPTVRALAPTFAAAYAAVERTAWSVLISRPWRHAEHINALELRAVLLALHWALSHPTAIGSRVLLLLDSLVAHGALWKGRCSSPALLLVVRKVSALLLAGGVSLGPGWLPSACNPADGPSRRGQSAPADC
jgi:hypothetical protein